MDEHEQNAQPKRRLLQTYLAADLVAELSREAQRERRRLNAQLELILAERYQSEEESCARQSQ